MLYLLIEQFNVDKLQQMNHLVWLHLQMYQYYTCNNTNVNDLTKNRWFDQLALKCIYKWHKH